MNNLTFSHTEIIDLIVQPGHPQLNGEVFDNIYLSYTTYLEQ